MHQLDCKLAGNGLNYVFLGILVALSPTLGSQVIEPKSWTTYGAGHCLQRCLLYEVFALAILRRTTLNKIM